MVHAWHIVQSTNHDDNIHKWVKIRTLEDAKTISQSKAHIPTMCGHRFGDGHNTNKPGVFCCLKCPQRNLSAEN